MTIAPSLEKYTIRTGRILGPDTVILLLESPEIAELDIPHAAIAIWRRGQDWIKHSVDFNAMAVSRLPNPSGSDVQFVIIGNTGKFAVVTDQGLGSGDIVVDDALASVTVVHSSVMAVGILGGIYQMTGPSTWQEVNTPSLTTNLSAICEYDASSSLVCGWEGLVAHLDGDNVRLLESGTNVILTSILCEESQVLACGQRGTILQGGLDTLTPLFLDGITEDFWSIARFHGETYVSSIMGLYRVVDDETLELVKFEDEVVASTFYHLDNYEDSLLLSVGMKDAVLFDGQEWVRIL